MTIKELDDRELGKVNGGTEDWALYSSIALEAFKTYNGPISQELKELINAMKKKDYFTVSVLVIPLLAKNEPFVKNTYANYLITKKQ